GDGGDGAGYFVGRPEQVVDQRVDRAFHLTPCAGAIGELHPLARAAFAADAFADALKLGSHALVGGDDVVKGVGDPTVDAGLVAWQANREVADLHRLQRVEQFAQVLRAHVVGSQFGMKAVFAIGAALTHRLRLWFHARTPARSARRSFEPESTCEDVQCRLA